MKDIYSLIKNSSVLLKNKRAHDITNILDINIKVDIISIPYFL